MNYQKNLPVPSLCPAVSVVTMNISRMAATTNFTCRTGFLRVYFLDYKNNAEYPSDDRSPVYEEMCARMIVCPQLSVLFFTIVTNHYGRVSSLQSSF